MKKTFEGCALLLDTTAEQLLVAVLTGAETQVSIGERGAQKRHTAAVLEAVEGLLTAAGRTTRELTHIGVVVGPGSFTGVRIGVATANAIALATGAKLVEITENEAMLAQKTDALALIDCRHGEYYAMEKHGKTKNYKVMTVGEVAESDLEKVYYTEPVPSGLISVFLEKVAETDFSASAKPFYMKKSSAEV